MCGWFILLTLSHTQAGGQNVVVQPSSFISEGHPRVFATGQDREALRKKVQDVSWARSMYAELKGEVDPLLQRTLTDRGFVVSRLQMNWDEGSRYTNFYTEGNFVTRREGDAPFPTVRVTYARAATGSTPLAPIDKIIPYGGGGLPLFKDGAWTQVPFTQTGLGTETFNQAILDEAYRAAIIYYLTGDKSYARFAADILWVFVRGASFQRQLNPQEDYDSNGYLSYETLGDTRHFATIALTYDFLYNYLQQDYFTAPEFKNGITGQRWAVAQPGGKSWANDRIHLMFEKFLDNKIERGGGLRGNWNMNEQQSSTLYALALDDDSAYADHRGREYYVQQLVYGKVTRGNGPLAEVARANLNADTGLWPEAPSGYGQGSIAQLVRLGFWYWKNGIDLLGGDPLLKKAALSFPEISFPNGISTNWGDGSYSPIQTEEAEEMVAYARAHDDVNTEETFSALIQFAGQRNFKSEYYSALFFFVPELKPISTQILYPRVSYSQDHSLIFERNLSDNPQDALAYTVFGFGARSGHRQPNGMAMELYGRGEVEAFSPGQGHDYWSDDHIRYQSNVAGHNDVIPNGMRAEDKMPQDLVVLHAEPEVAAGEDPKFQLSPYFQFTDTFDDFKTGIAEAHQRRVMGIVRLSQQSGYYIDVFRSRMEGSKDDHHDYLYHNLGSKVELTNSLGGKAESSASSFTQDSGPGYDFFSDVRQFSGAPDHVADFDMGYDGIHMKAFLLGGESRTLYSMNAPVMWRTNVESLRTDKTSAVIVRQAGEAWKRPFIAVYEPFGNGVASQVKAVHALATGGGPADLVAVEIDHTEGNDFMLSATDSSPSSVVRNISFAGIYGVVASRLNGETTFYLGCGRILRKGNIGIGFDHGDHAATVTVFSQGGRPHEKGIAQYSSQTPFRLSLPASSLSGTRNRSWIATSRAGIMPIKVVSIGNDEIELQVPAASDAFISVTR
jgi:hypothetical protein